MIKVILYGSNGQMGQVMSKQIANEDDMEIVAGIDRDAPKEDLYPVYNSPYDFKGEADVIVDFSHPSSLTSLLKYATERQIPLVIATTGLSDNQLDEIALAAKKIPILHSSNMSLGINALSIVLERIAAFLNEGFDIEIIEKHHNQKVDSPSGTAYLLADVINEALDNSREYSFGRQGNDTKRQDNEIGIHAVRGGTIPGEHTVIFAGLDEIIELKHSALSKNVFASGAIRSARFIIGAEKGLYNINDLFANNL